MSFWGLALQKGGNVEKPKVIVICGPTASGKTGLSIEVAKEVGGEIVSADSMQIYKEMDIGTAKVTKEEAEGIRHYMIDVVSPEEKYSVAEYKKQAEEAIEVILNKKKVPIIVGGTGLYVNSLVYNIEYHNLPNDEEYRKYLEQRVEEEGLSNLYREACEIDEKAMKKISINDKKRILRVLEMYHQTGKTKTQLEEESRKNEPKYDYCIFALEMEREKLYDRIEKRVDIMVKDGLMDEVRNLLEKYTEFPTAMQGLGYKEVTEYLKGQCTEEEMIQKLKQETRRYAKRQMTWFRKLENVVWLNTADGLQKNKERILEGIC